MNAFRNNSARNEEQRNEPARADLGQTAKGRPFADRPAAIPIHDEQFKEHVLHELTVYQLELESQNEQLKETQSELEFSRSQLNELYSDAPLGLMTLGIQGRILSCNRRAAELLRLHETTTYRRRITEFMSPDNAYQFMRSVTELYRTREAATIELELRRSDGRGFWAEITMRLSRESDEGSRLCQLVISDQSERKHMRDDTARLVAIVASSAQAIISQDLDGSITSWNAGAEQLFGYSAVEVLGHSIDFILPPDRADEEEHVRSRVRRQLTVADESVRLRRDGTTVPVFFSAAPILDRLGRVCGVSHILRDISEQVAARQEVARLLDTLRNADRRKDDFIATLAHELRNPLAPIRNAAAVMRYMPDLNPKLQWCRDIIDRQVSHMAALLEDLLDVSRLTRDKITLRRERVELGTAIAQAVEINRPMMEHRGHRLTVQLAPHPIEVEGDVTRLIQIFGNLLSNAAKYTESNGHISVKVQQLDGEVIVCVQDNGIGIKPENIAGIFDLFAQINPSGEGPEGGLGIGLALVKGLVERHGGNIIARSEGLGRGSEFIVALPVAKSTRPMHSDELVLPDMNPSDGHSLRILVVDDNVDAAETLGMILSTRHDEVQTAHDGESALEVAGDFRPHLVILDIGMPRMNGFEVAKRIRATPWGKDVILVACTGWGQPDDRRRSHEAGFNHHLVKPVSVSAVLQLMDEILVPEPR